MRTSLLAATALLLLAGCTDMKDDSRLKPLEASTMFDDGSSARPLVEGTVARGQLREDDRLYRGVDESGAFVTAFPLEVGPELLARGEQRYDIYCSPCHGQAGYGDGMVVRRGYKRPPSYHLDRLRGMPHGYFYDVISNGFGTMSSYASQIQPEDRWAIVAWVRALQLSQRQRLEDLDPALRERLEREGTVDTRGQEGEDHEPSGH